MNVALVGEEAAAAHVLRAVLRAGHRVAALFSEGSPAVGAVAREHGLALEAPARVGDPGLAADLRARSVELLLNVHGLHVIHPAVLEAPRLGAFNLHPGPLPRYAGLNGPSWAVLRRETSYGVTVHRMTARIDAGAIAYQAVFPLADTDTGLSVALKCTRAGIPLVERLVETAGRDPHAIPAIPQDAARREYFGREVPRRGALVWSEPAAEVLAFVRAFDYHPFPSPWGTPRARYGDGEIGVVKAERTGRRTPGPPGLLRREASDALEVATADEWIALKLLRVGDRHVTPEEVLTPGRRMHDGDAG